MNYLIIGLTALVPLLIGFIWYNPKVFGNAWMQVAGVDEEKLKSGNMGVIFGVTYLFGLFLAAGLVPIVIHQMGVGSTLAGVPDAEAILKEFMDKYGSNYRTFKHGALHGVISAFFLALPFLGINALFERRGFKYIGIHLGYWIVTLGIMGGILCQFIQL